MRFIDLKVILIPAKKVIAVRHFQDLAFPSPLAHIIMILIISDTIVVMNEAMNKINVMSK